jgi:S-adenosylmethionine-diacylgycerolhomoserine-N-methlytransferase
MLTNQLKSVVGIAKGMPNTGNHKTDLEEFYAPQSESYDYFRKRLLKGRREMLSYLCLIGGQKVVEVGCGTGQNLDYLDPSLIRSLERLDLVDLCPSLVKKAKERARSFDNIKVVETNGCEFDPGTSVDRVYFSYSLTMIPDWVKAIRNAYRILRPGGLIGIVDFCPEPVTAKQPGDGFSSKFWKKWFAHDGVFLERSHFNFLNGMFEAIEVREGRNSIPLLPFLHAHYYIFIGRK